MIGVVIGSVVTVIFGALIALLVFGLCKASKSKRLLRSGNNSSRAGYLPINDEGSTHSAVMCVSIDSVCPLTTYCSPINVTVAIIHVIL